MKLKQGPTVAVNQIANIPFYKWLRIAINITRRLGKMFLLSNKSKPPNKNSNSLRNKIRS
jgi:hypothetical protein